jgi:hypothetical protein
MMSYQTVHREIDALIVNHRNELQDLLKTMSATIAGATSLEALGETEKVCILLRITNIIKTMT